MNTIYTNMNIGLVVDQHSDTALDSAKRLQDKYDVIILNDIMYAKGIECIVTLGGDGVMLHALHTYMDLGVPFYGMNRGSLGFLLNSYSEDDLIKRIEDAKPSIIHPLEMNAVTADGQSHQELAFNEVSLMRDHNQSAKIEVHIDNTLMMKELVSDGILVSTPAGSTAYNFAVHGPILPIGCNLMALTPISPFRPRRWKGALIPYNRKIEFKMLEAEKRPVNAVADFKEHLHVVNVTVHERTDINIKLLFDDHETFNQKIVREQFAT